MLSTSFTWMLDTNQNASEKLITDLQTAKIISPNNINILGNNVYNLYNQNLINIIVFAIVVSLSVVVLISNYSFIVQRTHKLEIERKSLENPK